MKKTLLLVAALAITSQNAFAQTNTGSKQLTGSFTDADGGFEGQTVGNLTVVSGDITPNLTTWVQDNANAVASIGSTTGVARSGNNYLVTTATSTGKYILSPSLGNSLLGSGLRYVVQFYYTTTSTTVPVKGAINSSWNNKANGAISPAFGGATTSYVKGYYINTASTGTPTVTASQWAGFGTASPATNGTTTIDDFVVYLADSQTNPLPDTTAPDAPTGSAEVNNADINLTWTAPSSGVDGGGYAVVKYTSVPGAVDLPNVNGIYAVNNTIDNTANSGLVGTVVYTGTDTSYTDTALDAGTYYYKIFTVDKAFNYSTELLVSGTVAGSLGLTSLSANNAVKVYKDNGVFVANSGNKMITNITVFDMNGRVISKQNNLNNASVSLQNLSQKKGVFIVEVTTNDNKKVSVKIIN